MADSEQLNFDDDQKTVVMPSDSGGTGVRIPADELRKALNVGLGDRVEDFQNIRAIGIGGVGAVFSAYEAGLNREIALKVLRPQYRNDPERIAGFIREARITAQIDHPNIIQLHRIGVFDDTGVYFTMKRVSGETLRSILRKLSEDVEDYRHDYSISRLLEIFLGACHGVAFAHRHGIIHCDLKPGNLMVGDYGEVMVMDWGMARCRTEPGDTKIGVPDCVAEDGKNNSAECNGGGTPAFMAPELVTAPPKPPTELSDIYALGCILYSILTWKPAPFPTDLPVADLVELIARGRFPKPRKVQPKSRPVPRELQSICLKAMARDDKERYQTVQELVRDVRNYLDGYGVSAHSPSLFYRFYKLLARRPLIPATLAAALLTWGAFSEIIYQTNLSRSNTFIKLGKYNYDRAMEYEGQLRWSYKQNRKYSDGYSTDSDAGPDKELLQQMALAEGSVNAALDFISRATEFGGKEREIREMVTKLFRTRIAFYLESGNHDALKAFVSHAHNRWRHWFYQAQLHDSGFRTLIRRIEGRIGTLLVTAEPDFFTRYRMTIEDKSEPLTLPDGRSAKDLPLLEKADRELVLPTGNYQLRFRSENGDELSYPVRVAPAEETIFRPERINLPLKNTVFIPEGDFIYQRDGELFPRRRVWLDGYFISKYEVTVGEYHEFWKQLPEGKQKLFFAPRFDFNQTGEQELIFQPDGGFRVPFTADLPIVGIPGEAAEAYCRYLGRKLNLVGRLPSWEEWEKAACGVDSRSYSWGEKYQKNAALLLDHDRLGAFPVGARPGSFPKDCSPFGVYDLTGNVRELIRSPMGKSGFYGVQGGSYRTDSDLADTSHTDYIRNRGDDIGFRFLLESPNSETLRQTKQKE